MTIEAPTTNPYSVEERMARIEAQQELIIELLRNHNEMMREQSAKIDALDKKFDAKFDAINAKFDTAKPRIGTTKPRTATFISIAKPRFYTTYDRIFFAVVVLSSLLGSFLAVQIVNLFT